VTHLDTKIWHDSEHHRLTVLFSHFEETITSLDFHSLKLQHVSVLLLPLAMLGIQHRADFCRRWGGCWE
jgi:hypothetical protein